MQKMRQGARELLLRLLRTLQGRTPRDRVSRPTFYGEQRQGVWRFNWLPVHEPASVQPGPLVYRSHGLARHLGLEQLFIAFNGYWPEKGAMLETCTFKEFEAAVVLQNARENGVAGLIVASAGNTARAFAHLSTVSGFPVVIVVRECACRRCGTLKAFPRCHAGRG